MKRIFKATLTLLLIILVGDMVMAQGPTVCGMSSADLAEVKRQMLENRKEMANYVADRSTISYIPVRFHMVADANGEGRASERQAIQALCIINENYAPHDIQFFLEEFSYINNSTIYNNPGSFSGGLNISTNMVYDALNIFVVGADLGSGGGGGVVQAYYQPPAGPGAADWIVVNKTFLTDTYVVTHEIGHFFSLPHPFSGWDNIPWDPDDHGNPVNEPGNIAPDSPPGEDIIIEFADGTNCDIAGDLICDTPADYNFGITYNSGCNYTGNAQDPNGVPLNPLKENIMNYFGCNTQTFTPGQVTEMHNSVEASNRNYLETDYVPVTDIIEGSTALISPAQLETIDNYNYVNLEWEAKDGATHYLVAISGAQGFNVIAETNAVGLDNLLPDATYLWQVTPFNESGGCANSSTQQIFRTGTSTTAVQEVNEIESWFIAPNPVGNGQNVRLQMEASESFEADFSLMDLTGKMVINLPGQLVAQGNSTFFLETAGLPSGMYTVVVRTQNGVSNQRLVIAR